MINIVFNPDRQSIHITGHAESAPKGEDIVCASASMLIYALAATLKANRKMLKYQPYVRLEEGNAKICCTPKKAYNAVIAAFYHPIIQGFALLAEQYPQYVTFEFKGTYLKDTDSPA